MNILTDFIPEPAPAIHCDKKAILEFPKSPLSETDQASLLRCESILFTRLSAFFEVGTALTQIMEKKLYREHFNTFEEYCRSRCGMSRFHAHRQIQGARTMQHLLTLGNIPLPKNERQVRPLSGLPAKRIQKVWQQAIQNSEGKKITARHVREALLRFKRQPIPPANPPETWQELVKPILHKALKATATGERDTVIDALNKAVLLAGVGNTRKPDI